MNIELVITTAIAGSALIQWLYEYSQKLKWDKNVYLVDKLDEFQSKDSTKLMQMVLDWNAIRVDLNGKQKTITDNILIGAFETHDKRDDFTELEAELRPIFDEYFDNLNRFVFLAKTKIVSEKHLRKILGYWFNILSGKSETKPKELVDAIENYLEFYGYSELKQFMKNNNGKS